MPEPWAYQCARLKLLWQQIALEPGRFEKVACISQIMVDFSSSWESWGAGAAYALRPQ